MKSKMLARQRRKGRTQEEQQGGTFFQIVLDETPSLLRYDAHIWKDQKLDLLGIDQQRLFQILTQGRKSPWR
jgi:hypothetical protein